MRTNSSSRKVAPVQSGVTAQGSSSKLAVSSSNVSTSAPDDSSEQNGVSLACIRIAIAIYNPMCTVGEKRPSLIAQLRTRRVDLKRPLDAAMLCCFTLRDFFRVKALSEERLMVSAVPSVAGD